MTQKSGLFKGQKKRKTVPLNRHGKAPTTRKGKRYVKPSNFTSAMDTDRELTKFINKCNEVKAATAANKEGGQLCIVVEREREEEEVRERNEKREEEMEMETEVVKVKDLEKGEVGLEGEEKVVHDNNVNNGEEFQISMMQRLNPTNPLRVLVQNSTRVDTPSPSQFSQHSTQPRFTPTPQPSITTLNSRAYTNKISLFLFLVHMVAAIGLVGFLIYKGVQGILQASDIKRKEMKILKFYIPQVEASSLLSITLAFAWQKALREWPKIMVPFILWSSFLLSLSAGILLICFQKPSTDGVGVCFIAFAIGNGLYACWVTQRMGFCSRVLIKALEPVSKFPDINHPIYLMLGVAFIWMSLWILAVIGALNFYLPPLIIILLVLSLAWTAEVMRNVANITVSRVIALYYLRGMQSSTQFCFQRALTKNLGSACLGSLFVPTIEALRIVARALNLLEGEDEFMFSCAHCCLNVMQSIFRYGNGWAFVQVLKLNNWQEIVPVVDADMTSSICFLTGVCSGSICVIVAAAWTARVHQSFTATISLLVFIIGYLMTRIAMAVPHACVGCYYVCYAENPDNRLFDKTIKDRVHMIQSGRDVVVPTPRLPRRYTT
ncbi:hypothetical protein G4B88_015003 [Cannabis sativa]|uniref:Choline transporter-like protein n=1 Tax=Cannabis sativa TaxID=3483 RepID=A0A7J6DLE1_CANSA|nr:hypothetical protein G4B88_015003 [Cannabis sativa]